MSPQRDSAMLMESGAAEVIQSYLRAHLLWVHLIVLMFEDNSIRIISIVLYLDFFSPGLIIYFSIA